MTKLPAALLLSSLVLANFSASADPFPRSSPEEQGVSSEQLLKLVTALDTEIEGLHSVMVVRHGHVIAEGWWSPYASEHNHVLYSLSKSFTSTAVGIAVAEGKLSIDDKVLSFFPDDAPAEPDRNLQQMRVRDLLTMTTGHQDEPSAAIDTVSPKSFLASPVPHKPGTHFKYNTAATFMLSAIVEKQTGERLVDYLRPRLFEPLGIENPKWDTNSQGIALGGYGLRVRTEDIAKLGQLYLQQGEWKGHRLLDADWVALATSRQVSNGSNPESDWDQGYGFQFWQCRNGAYRGDGAFGQYCVVLPEQDAVVAITSGLGNMQGVLDILWKNLLPAFHAVPLEGGDPSGLNAKLAGLMLPVPEGEVLASRGVVRFPENEVMLESVSWKSTGNGSLTLISTVDGKEYRQPCAYGKWAIGGTQPDGERTAASFAWTKPTELTVKICAYETPFITTVRLRFDGAGSVELVREMNVGFGQQKAFKLTGTTGQN
ncbi:MAG: serine hydrolase [Verrucomicrobiales bacterium]